LLDEENNQEKERVLHFSSLKHSLKEIQQNIQEKLNQKEELQNEFNQRKERIEQEYLKDNKYTGFPLIEYCQNSSEEENVPSEKYVRFNFLSFIFYLKVSNEIKPKNFLEKFQTYKNVRI